MRYYKGKLVEEIFVEQDSFEPNMKPVNINIDEYIPEDKLHFNKVSVEEFKKEVENQYNLIMQKIEEDKKRLRLFKGGMNKNLYGLQTKVTKLYTYVETKEIIELPDDASLCAIQELGEKLKNIKLDDKYVYGSSMFLEVNGWCDGDDVEYDGAAYAITYINVEREPAEYYIKKQAIELAIYHKISPVFYTDNGLCELFKMLTEEELTMKGFIKKIDPRIELSC